MNYKNIRNFSIIAHIDHGKSTLADRMLEITGVVKKAEGQLLDSMELEQERGITIKLKAVRMPYKKKNQSEKDAKYQLNIIDTPGHVDFGYEVSRALAACEGAVLLVDATQGVQAQTIVNFEKAKALNLKIIPVLNKIDLPSAQIEETMFQLIDMGFSENEILSVSAKTGEGVKELLDEIVDKIPPPETCSKDTGETKALVFDSYYDEFRGVIAFVKVEEGEFKVNSEIELFASKTKSRIVDLGYLSPNEIKDKTLSCGEVGFIATGLKDIANVRVGDTIFIPKEDQKITPIPGYKEPVPVVFLSFYPADSSDYLKLREAMEKLNLSDAAFTFQPESIGAIGKGFRCGFLGLLHADIIQERIEREFDIEVITTSPSVRYEIVTTKGEKKIINSATEFPDPTTLKEVKEPWAKLDIYTTSKYMSAVMDLCKSRRAIYIGTDQFDATRVRVSYEIPLIEIIIDFYDKLKSISSGYASIDYEVLDYRSTDVVKIDILVAGDLIAPLSQLVQRANAQQEGKRIVSKLKELIPRQQFKVSIQAAIGGKIIARENISPVRKDVTGHLYGGDVTRKMKLLEKQKKGKKRMKRFGKVDIPQNVFWKVMER